MPTDADGASACVAALARELTSRGHDVTAASFCGASKLKALIKHEKFDIIHAHSTIAASACSRLARRTKFRFVTTVYALSDFENGKISTSDFGEHTFVPSCELKQYLIDNFAVPSDNITLLDSDVSQTAEQHLETYNKFVLCNKYRHGDIIISGYYGYDNVGDDSLLPPMVEGIRKRLPDAKITVLARHPKKVARICKTRTVNRFNLFGVLSEMKHARLLISGGGSLLQDGTSKKSLFYYTYIINAAKKRGLRVMIYANGLGPLSAPASRKSAAAAIEAADYVSLRERDSLELLGKLGVKREAKVTADPALLLTPASDTWIDHVQKREKIAGDFFLVSVKDGNTFDGEKTGRDILGSMAQDIRTVADKYSMAPLFVPMYPSRDTEITKRIAGMVGCGKVLQSLTARELCGLIKRARFVIGTRLHMLVFSASMAVPLLGITYDPKIDAFLEYIGERGRMLDIRELADGELLAAVDTIISEESEIRARLSTAAEMLRLKANEDCDAVKMFFD